ncbi:threonine aldolase [Candidatus Planktophila lacus]|uniref:threonine aldolase family protein n=1 Tax=Candidatus Planktophila lacus TaxID=1884913 RepID=UPI000BACB4CA|nr:GntG family PLP-dependent aldolase [Candidatus Planktophila lacus]ASY28889.1 threonine aldolase [Candidatus Planktophila lacus]
MANPIDLRSDTVTRPSQAMRQAMASAEVGDDVYSDDPMVNSLEERVAALFGKEAGVFTPTGSLANQLAIRMLVAPGEELIAETNSHIVRAELGAAAVFSGITTRTWPAKNGLLVAKDALEIARPNSGPYLVSTTAIAVENTHNFGGGTVQPLEEIKALRKGADEIGVALHLDGARIWNAHVASGVAFTEYGKYFDTISVCLSKGLGAPIGSVMLSTKERVTKARIWRKRYGAGMRQVGLLAGAAHYALDNNIARLSEDHRRAKELAVAIAAIDKSFVDPALVETNIVGLDLANAPYTAAELATRCREAGLWISALGPKYARLVTHLDFDDEQCAAAIEILKRVLVA